MSRKDQGLWRIFRAPIILFLLSMTGLVGALLTDGLWDAVFAACLSSTVIATVWALIRSRS